MTAQTLVFVVNNAAFFVSHRLPIALEAQRRGWTVALVTGAAGSTLMEAHSVSRLREAAIAHHRLPFGSASINPLLELWGLIRLVWTLRKLRPDIVHCASPKGMLYGGLAARLAGVPSLVLAVSGLGYAFTGGSARGTRAAMALVSSFLAKFAFGHPNMMAIVQNETDQRWLETHRLCAPQNIRLVPGSGVDLSEFEVAEQSVKKPWVVFPARMLRDKGLIDFVEAVRRTRNNVPQSWRFLLAGVADYKNPSAVPERDIRGWVSEGLVEWLGFVDNMPALLAQASIVCLPSYREGLPKALIEAAAAGCAVITTDTVGCRDAVDSGSTADLVPVADPEALAAALRALIDDPARVSAYGRSGRKLAENRFSIEAILGEVFDIYRRLQYGRTQAAP